MRRSPPGKPQQEEDWPVLFPEKPTTPGTLQEMARQEGSYSSLKFIPTENKGRYSARADVESKIPSLQRKPLKGDWQSSSGQSIERKPTPKSSVQSLRTTSRDTSTTIIQNSSKAVREIRSEQKLRTSTSSERIRGAGLPSASVAVQRSVDNLQGLSYQRQTSTSLRRAHISAGGCSTEGPPSRTQVVNLAKAGATDEHSAPTRIKGSRFTEDLNASSRSPAAGRPAKDASGTSGQAGDRAPDKVVVRARRPGLPIRSTSPTPSPRQNRPPTRPQPVAPKAKGPNQAILGTDEQVSRLPSPGLRKSSIPVLRHPASGQVRNLVRDTEISAKKLWKRNEERHEHRTTSLASEEVVTAGSEGSTEDLEHSEAAEFVKRPTSSNNTDDGRKSTRADDQIASGKKAKDSPERGVRVKRLSRLSPENGPVLKISPAADKLILGDEPGKKENAVAQLKNGKDLHRAVLSKELHKASQVSEPSTTSLRQAPRRRPSSATGDFQLTSRHVLTQLNPRERKAMSADGAYSGQSVDQTHKVTRKPRSSATTSVKPVNSTNDPFLDTRSHFDGAIGAHTTQSQVEDRPGGSGTNPESDVEAVPHNTETVLTETAVALDEKTDVVDAIDHLSANDEIVQCSRASPMRNSQESVRLSNIVPVAPPFPPVTTQEDISGGPNSSTADQFTPNEGQVTIDSASVSSTKDRHRSSLTDTTAVFDNAADQMVTIEEMLSPSTQRPSTPMPFVRRASRKSLNEFPPRSSSRAYVHRDFTTEPYKAAGVSIKYIDPRLSKDFQPIQDKLGQANGIPSTRYDLETNQPRRDSTARESNKSQGSTSKGMLSNFRGLFHKRSSDNSEHSSLRSTQSGKRVAITMASSPYPPISEVHPVHRPIRHLRTGSATRATTPEPRWKLPSRDATPISHSPVPPDTTITNTLTMELIQTYHTASPGPRRDQLQKLSEIMVEAVTNARNANRAMEEAKVAMEEAKHAARRAEMFCMRTEKRTADLARCTRDQRLLLD